MINILVVDQVLLMCEVIAATLQDEDDIRVVGMANSLDDALERIDDSSCDLVLISTNLGEGEAIELIECTKRDHPDIKILVIGMANSEAVILSFVEAGASGYVLMEDSLEELLNNIRAVYENKAFVTPEVAAALMERIANLSAKLTDMDVDPSAYEDLTAREKEALALIAAGYSNREMAKKLTVEIGTVKNHVHNILAKLSVNSRKDAAAYLALMEKVKSANGSC
ncbi:MAG: response regulator transcription factor [Caldilineaceae bacterium]